MTVQQKLGVTAQCPAFDISAACAGFIYGMSIADAFMRSGTFKRVLVIGVEVLSRVVDWTDRNTCVLFGDGAGAAVLGAARAARRARHPVDAHLRRRRGRAVLNIPGGGSAEPATAKTRRGQAPLRQDAGQAGVHARGQEHLGGGEDGARRQRQGHRRDVDWVVAHQANMRILQGVAERLGMPLEKFYLNIHKYGNTSSASIPIALDEAVREGKVKPGDLLLMAALGAGLSWGSALVRF